jgi:DNA-binding CsgD family transcriptional regulator
VRAAANSRASRRLQPHRVIARIQRLCCLGLGSQAIMPALLKEIADLTPSSSREFDWAGPNYELVNCYSDSPNVADVLPVYFAQYHNLRERDYRVTFDQVMATPYDAAVDDFFQRCLKVPWAEFQRSDGYNLILRPLGAHKRLQMKVSERGVGLGVMNVNRLDSEPDFSERDMRALEAVAPFVAHALTEPVLDTSLADTEESGLIIATAEGKIEHTSAQSRRLLLMATRDVWSGATRWSATPELPPPLVRLCRDVVRAFQGRTPAAPPVWFHRNAWGGFEFRAYPLDPGAGSPASGWVGLTARRHESLALRLFRRIDALPLSPREIDYVLLAAAGQTRAAIAERMGVSIHTAQTHGRNIYAKLGVHTRAALLETLRAL